MRPDVKEEQRWETLEIVFQPGSTPGSSCFAAKAIGLFGVYISGESSTFDCADRPDQLNKDHIVKLDNLLNRLIEAGWEINPERGPEWWNHRFRRKMVEKNGRR